MPATRFEPRRAPPLLAWWRLLLPPCVVTAATRRAAGYPEDYESWSMKQIRKELKERGIDAAAECRGCSEKREFIEVRPPPPAHPHAAHPRTQPPNVRVSSSHPTPSCPQVLCRFFSGTS